MTGVRQTKSDPRFARAQELEDENSPGQYEKDMTTLEAQQDTYFVLFAALLNVSVLKSVQPVVAKKGLMVSLVLFPLSMEPLFRCIFSFISHQFSYPCSYISASETVIYILSGMGL